MHKLGIKVNATEYDNFKNLTIVDNRYSDHVTSALFDIFEDLYGSKKVSETFKKLSDGLLIKFPEEGIHVAIIKKYTSEYVHTKLYAIRSYTVSFASHNGVQSSEVLSEPSYKIRFYLKPDAYVNDKLPKNTSRKRVCWGEISYGEMDEMRSPYENEEEDEY